MACQQFGLQDLIGVVDIVDHLDAGRLLESGGGVFCDIVGPVIDMQHSLVLGEGGGGDQGAEAQKYQGADRLEHGTELETVFSMSCADTPLRAAMVPASDPAGGMGFASGRSLSTTF